jgi:hypothetical protein
VSEDGSKIRQWAAEHLSVKRVWVGGGAAPAVAPPPPVEEVRPAEVRTASPDMDWSPARIQAAESIWGEGFLMPGGEADMLSLTRPLNLNSDSSLLLMGGASGGPARTLVSNYGTRITTVEADPQLAELAAVRLARTPNIAARVTPLEWRTPVPPIRPLAFDRTLALWPLRGEADPAPILSQIFRSLRPWGQIVMRDLVADVPLDPSDPTVASWSLLERRSPVLPSETEMVRLLKAQGLNVKLAEDVSDQHARQALTGWDTAVRQMERSRPSRAQAARLVSEAELWLLRLRLLRERRIRVMQWHAFSRG